MDKYTRTGRTIVQVIRGLVRAGQVNTGKVESIPYKQIAISSSPSRGGAGGGGGSSGGSGPVIPEGSTLSYLTLTPANNSSDTEAVGSWAQVGAIRGEYCFKRGSLRGYGSFMCYHNGSTVVGQKIMEFGGNSGITWSGAISGTDFNITATLTNATDGATITVTYVTMEYTS
jgi:hypothetical protein